MEAAREKKLGDAGVDSTAVRSRSFPAVAVDADAGSGATVGEGLLTVLLLEVCAAGNEDDACCSFPFVDEGALGANETCLEEKGVSTALSKGDRKRHSHLFRLRRGLPKALRGHVTSDTRMPQPLHGA